MASCDTQSLPADHTDMDAPIGESEQKSIKSVLDGTFRPLLSERVTEHSSKVEQYEVLSKSVVSRKRKYKRSNEAGTDNSGEIPVWMEGHTSGWSTSGKLAPSSTRFISVIQSKKSTIASHSFTAVAVLLLVMSLFSSAIGTTTYVYNEDVAEVGLSICYVDALDKYTDDDKTYMPELLSSIADEWRISEDQITLGVYEVKPQEEKVLLPIPAGNSPTALTDVAQRLLAHRENNSITGYDNRSQCLQQGLEEGRHSLKSDLSYQHPEHRANIWIGVTVFRTKDSFKDSTDWKAKVFDDQANQYLGRGFQKRSDVYLILEAGSNYNMFGVMWTRVNDSIETSCCQDDVKKMASTIQDAMTQVMKLCPIEQNEMCYISGVGYCRANVTYKPKYNAKEPEAQYCYERKDTAGVNCSNSQECVDATTTPAPRRSRIPWGWLGACLAAMAIACIVAIIAAIRQCRVYSRQRKLDKEQLDECGYGKVCPTKRRPVKAIGSKALDVSSASTLTETKLTTEADIPIAALNRTSLRSVQSVKSRK